jgi:hypothetical protein
MNALLRHVEDWISAFQKSAELDRIDARELTRLADDACVPPGELRRLYEMPADSAELLDRRLEASYLTEAAHKNPMVYRDLQRVCSQCQCKGWCEDDLDRNATNPAWKAYCPNVATLESLR